jgi:NADPH-dependent 7-cyano-7-deazaguanine reductase QueF
VAGWLGTGTSSAAAAARPRHNQSKTEDRTEMTEDRTEMTEDRTEKTETEIFGHRFGSRCLITKIISVNSVLGLG